LPAPGSESAPSIATLAAAVALARRFLRVILYVLVPIVIFCNLAKASISLENAVGWASAGDADAGDATAWSSPAGSSSCRARRSAR